MTWNQFIADVRRGWLPCSITLFGIFLIPLIFIACNSTQYYIATGLYTLGWISDGLDGWAARKFGATSQTGSFLDPLADKFFTISFIVYFWEWFHPVISVLVISIAVAITAVRLFKVQEAKTRNIISSLMAIKPGKYKTNIEKSAFAILLLSLIFFQEINIYFQIVANIVLACSLPFAVLSLTNQISPETIAKLSEIYNRKFHKKLA